LDHAAAIVWEKSSHSTYNGNCIEVGVLASGKIGVRDSKDKAAGTVLTFSVSDWSEFLNVVKNNHPRIR
jgi:hypothetical protein